jgi:acyl carrier protein
MNDTTTPSTPPDAALQTEVAEQIVAALNLEMAASEIEADAPLYGDGLGLDSIDILEVALVLSKRYGFSLRADNEDNVRIFASLRNLTEYVAAHRTQ